MWFLMACFYFLLSILLHRIGSFFKILHGAITGFCAAAFISGIVFLVHANAIFAFAEQGFAGIIWYLFFCEFYMFLFTLSLGSVSVKLLRLLYHAPKVESEIVGYYKPSNMLDMRLQRLETAELISNKEGNLYLTSKGLFITKIAILLRGLLHGK